MVPWRHFENTFMILRRYSDKDVPKAKILWNQRPNENLFTSTYVYVNAKRFGVINVIISCLAQSWVIELVYIESGLCIFFIPRLYWGWRLFASKRFEFYFDIRKTFYFKWHLLRCFAFWYELLFVSRNWIQCVLQVTYVLLLKGHGLTHRHIVLRFLYWFSTIYFQIVFGLTG